MENHSKFLNAEITREYIRDIDIKGYRNLKDTKLTFSDGINIIYGENAQGKTNLLEAIWLVSGGKSFRGTKDRDMIGFDADGFRIEANVADGERELNLVVACSKTDPKFSSRMAKRNNGSFRRASQIAGSFYCVIFSPDHLNIVSGGPALRRKFMDACLIQLSDPFTNHYKRYQKALTTRNAFLRDIKKYDESQQQAVFQSLDNILGESAYYIYKQRKYFCDSVGKKAAEYYREISGGKEKLEIVYNNCAETELQMINRFVLSHERDIMYGTTNFGVHREDISIYLDGRLAKDYASQGQQRSIVIALKLAESDLMENHTEISPVILLDDVLSELDFSRQDYLLNNIKNKQVFITTCDTDRIMLSESKKIHVSDGVITQE